MSTSLEILNSNIVKLYEKTRSSSVGQKTADGGEIFNVVNDASIRKDNVAGGRCFRITALSEPTENYNITSSEIILNDELNDKILIGGEDSTSLKVEPLTGTNPWEIFNITLDAGIYHIHNLEPEYVTVGFYIALNDDTTDQFRFIDSSDYIIEIMENNTVLRMYYGDSSSFGDGATSYMPTGSYRSMLIELTGGLYTLDSVEGIEHGDIVSLKIGANYDFFSTICRVHSDSNTVLCKHFTAGTSGGDLTNAVMWFPYKPQIGTQVNGGAQSARGYTTTALNWGSSSEGYNTLAEGRYSHAQNHSTIAGYAAHSEGQNTRALAEWSHAQNMNTTALGKYSTSLGYSTVGIDNYFDTVTSSLTVEDIENAWDAASTKFTVAFGPAALAGGINTLALNKASTALGEQTVSKGQRSLSLGYITVSEGDNSLTGGFNNKTYGDNSTTLGSANISYGANNFIVGSSNSIVIDYTSDYPLSNNNFANITLMGTSNRICDMSSVDPRGNDIYAENCYIEGRNNALGLFGTSTIKNVHIEGYNNTSSGAAVASTHIEGSSNTISTYYHVDSVHIEGKSNKINTRVNAVHVEGYNNKVEPSNGVEGLVEYTHVEGSSNKVYCNNVHVEGLSNTATNSNAGHVGGWNNTINGDTAFAHGHGLKATGLCSFVIGRYNIENNASNAQGHRFIIGNGTSDTSRSNAFVVTADGKALLPSVVNNNIGSDVNAVATKGYVDGAATSAIITAQANSNAYADSKIMYGDELPTNIPAAGTIFVLI